MRNLLRVLAYQLGYRERLPEHTMAAIRMYGTREDLMEDRRVHAVTSFAEMVRYDRAGKWYVEDRTLGRSHVTVETAASLARHWESNGGEIRLGVPGGRRFDQLVRKAI